MTGAVGLVTLGLSSFRPLAVKPTVWPAAVRVSTSCTTGERPLADHLTLTVMRFMSAGCESSDSVPSLLLSAQKVESCLPNLSLGSSIEHSLAVTV